ncbi:MAG: hypothetical protein AAFP87_08555 [Pseudomonadota bacterium]
MMKKSALFALACAVTSPTLVDAQSTRRERFTLPVAQLTDTTFEIIEADGAGGQQIWCGAGIYVRRVLGLRGGELFISEGRGPSKTQPGRKSVVFSITPVPNAFDSTSPGVRRAGKSFSMTHAFALCSEMPFVRLRTENGQLIRRGI